MESSYVRRDQAESRPSSAQIHQDFCKVLGEQEVDSIQTDFSFKSPLAAVLLELRDSLQSRLTASHVPPFFLLFNNLPENPRCVIASFPRPFHSHTATQAFSQRIRPHSRLAERHQGPFASRQCLLAGRRQSPVLRQGHLARCPGHPSLDEDFGGAWRRRRQYLLPRLFRTDLYRLEEIGT